MKSKRIDPTVFISVLLRRQSHFTSTRLILMLVPSTFFPERFTTPLSAVVIIVVIEIFNYNLRTIFNQNIFVVYIFQSDTALTE